jgi:sterol desaturase/sphingolipid hydroxylase (fatty acid hydroxylase superfamily)
VNIGLGVLNAFALRLAAVVGPAAAAGWAQDQQIGLFNWVELPPAVVLITTIILMDLAIYWQHRASHHFGWFWAFHCLHHADSDFDVTTGIRFHPGEALLSMVYKASIGVLIGAPPAAMLAFELYLAIGSLTEHANIKLPSSLDRAIRRIWVTPAMHIIHHSADSDDQNRNFGFALSIWDQLFGTYRNGPMPIRIGVESA